MSGVAIALVLLLAACSAGDSSTDAAQSSEEILSGTGAASHDPCARADRSDIGRIIGERILDAAEGPAECMYFTALTEHDDGEETGWFTEGIRVRAEVWPYPPEDDLPVGYREQVSAFCQAADMPVVDDFLGVAGAFGCSVPPPSPHTGSTAMAVLFDEETYLVVVDDQGDDWSQERVQDATRSILKFLRGDVPGQGHDGSGTDLPEEAPKDAYTQVVLRVPDEADEAEFEAAVRIVASRAVALAPSATVTSERPDVIVMLPGVTDETVVDVLVEDPQLTFVPVLETHSPDSPVDGWPGCPTVVEDELWVCDPDESEVAHLVPKSGDGAKPSDVTVEGARVNLNFAAEGASIVAEVTAEIACGLDGERSMGILLGRSAIAMTSLSHQVDCGVGITGGEVSISRGSPEEAEQLAEALGAIYPIAPIVQSQSTIRGSSPRQ